MSKPIFLIGPSGVGKTTLGLLACELLAELVFLDLDDLVGTYSGESAGELLRRVRADSFLCCCRAALQDTMPNSPDQQLIVAVGAGCLDSNRAAQWLGQETTILITADQDEAHERIRTGRGDSRRREEYKRGEFSSGRRALYEAANETVDTSGQTKEQSAAVLVACLRKLGGAS